MSDELVKRLRGTPLYEGSGEDSDLGEEAADRIEALEAALSKALGALGDIGDGEPEWPDEPQKELDWCRNRALTAYRQARDATR